MQDLERHRDCRRPSNPERRSQLLGREKDEQGVREIARAEKSDCDEKSPIKRRQKAKPFAERNVRDRCALILPNEESNHGRGEQSRQKGAEEKEAVIVRRDLKENQRAERSDDRA